MITFHRKYTGDILVHQMGRVIPECNTYEVWLNGIPSGKFYSGRGHSFIELGNRNAVIESDRSFLRNCAFRIYDQATNNFVGSYEFSLEQRPGKLQCILRLSDGSVYFFIENIDHRQVFKPNTWNLYRFDMASNSVEISYFFRASENLTGEVTCNKKDHLFEIMTGFFIIEEKFRFDADNSG